MILHVSVLSYECSVLVLVTAHQTFDFSNVILLSNLVQTSVTLFSTERRMFRCLQLRGWGWGAAGGWGGGGKEAGRSGTVITQCHD